MLFEATRELVVRVPPKAFLDVMWDFQSYPKFMTGVKGIEVLGLMGGSSSALVRIDSGILGVPFRYVLDCRREPERITWKRTAGSFKDAFGAWTLLGQEDGASRFRYDNAVDPGFPAPAPAVRWILERSLPSMLDEVKTRVESMHARRTSRREPRSS